MSEASGRGRCSHGQHLTVATPRPSAHASIHSLTLSISHQLPRPPLLHSTQHGKLDLERKPL